LESRASALALARALLNYFYVSGAIKLRLAAFVLAMGIMIVVIAATAHISWKRTGAVRERLTAIQFQSFQIANHFQHTILELNNVVLRYGMYRDPHDWVRFESVSKALDLWIDEQRPLLGTEAERKKLDVINAAYDDYLAAACRIEAKLRARTNGTAELTEIAEFEEQAQRIYSLGFELAEVHRASMDTFLESSKRSLTWLRYLLLGSLALLMLAGGGLAVVVYREMIAPLQVKLVENQAMLERQEKLASLGMLAAGVAHEIRNPLTAIKAWLFIQQKDLKPCTPEFDDAQIISNEITRLERIVKDVLMFARPSEPHLKTVPADQPLREVRALMAVQLEQANIQLLVAEGLSAMVRIDPQQIQQVLINLVQNAAESIGRDGTVKLRAREVAKSPAITRSLFQQDYEKAVILEVSDTGKGIPPEVEKRLFDPFFTTKEAGTGLGLAIAARIVEKHGGSLQYQTQVNRGTTFGIVLPKVA
jgi:signal transduction histidine kinase